MRVHQLESDVAVTWRTKRTKRIASVTVDLARFQADRQAEQVLKAPAGDGRSRAIRP